MALTKITYDTKVALDPQPSVANINKVSDSDMNEIKSVVNNAIDQVDTNTNDITTLKQNIITDGSAVKTGRIIDGKDEYVKRFSFTTSGSTTYTKSLGFTLADVIITGIEATEISNTGNWWNANIGDYDNNSTFAQNINLVNNDNTIKLESNANFKNTYVNVYYIYKN